MQKWYGSMPKLPQVTGAEVVRAFERSGFQLDRISGSHHILKRDFHPFNLSVPVHGNKSIPSGTLRALIRDSGLTVEEFTALL